MFGVKIPAWQGEFMQFKASMETAHPTIPIEQDTRKL